MPKRGRPKVKKKDFKKPFPMRFSDGELTAFKQAAGDKPLREWMRHTLLVATPAYQGLKAMVDEAAGLRVKPAVPTRSLTPRAVESRS